MIISIKGVQNMLTKSFKIIDPMGFHARPVSVVVGVFMKSSSQVSIEGKGRKVNGKSMIQVMTLGLKQGETLTFSINGPDEVSVMATLENEARKIALFE